MNTDSMIDILPQALLRLSRIPRLSVLVYHRVLREADPLRPSEPTAVEFESRMRWLKANFNVMALADGVAGLKSGNLPARAIAITFDDGYRDNYEIAMPILMRLGLSATFFVATGYLDGGRMFNDTVIETARQARGDNLDLVDFGLGSHPIATDAQRVAAATAIIAKVKYLPSEHRTEMADRIAVRVRAKLPDDLMMTSEHLEAMHRAGMQIGGHTVMHPILTSVDPATARREISTGRSHLERIIGSQVRLFAYPNGRPDQDYTSEHARLVRELGFDAAFSTARGAACYGADRLQIPRFTPWDRPQWKFGLRMAQTILSGSFATAK